MTKIDKQLKKNGNLTLKVHTFRLYNNINTF